MPALTERLRSWWDRLRRRGAPPADGEREPPDEPAPVGAPTRPPRPSSAAEAEPPEEYEFEEGRQPPRTDE